MTPLQISVRQTLSGQFEWMASYTRSRARLERRARSEYGPAVAGAPESCADALGRAESLPGVGLSAVAVEELGRFGAGRHAHRISVLRSAIGRDVIVGAVDSYRYPLNFDLNIAIERMITFRGYRFALRGGDGQRHQSGQSHRGE